MTKKEETNIVAKKQETITNILNIFQAPFASILSFIDQFIAFIINKKLSEDNQVISYARPSLIFGLWVVFVFIICGGIWASFAPLDSAAHAQGLVISEVPKQLIQANYSAKVQKCFVKQGDIVNKDQVLLEIENKVQRSKYIESMDHYLELLALKDRLISQRDGLSDIRFSRILLEYKNVPRINKILEIQSNIFYGVLKANLNHTQMIQKQIDQQCEAKVMSDEKIKALKEKLNYINDILKINQNLEKKGFAPKLETTKFLSEKTFCISELNKAQGEKAVADIEMQRYTIAKAEVDNKLLTDTLLQLYQVNTALLEVETKLTAAEESLKNIFIRSPIKGKVNYITKEHTIGVSNNNLIAEVTPIDENLVVEVKIPNSVIDMVKVGQKTKVNFMAFNSRIAPTFFGTLISLTPNVVPLPQHLQSDPRIGRFYMGLIKMDQKSLDKFLKPRKLKLITGIQADVQIITGERTLLRYLLDPILDQSFKAFTEK